MNRNLIIGIGVIVLLAIGGLTYIVPAVFPQNSMTVAFYDENDNIIHSESTALNLIPFNYINAAGTTVTKVVVTVNYDTSITGATSSSILANCELTWVVRLNTQTAGIVNGPTSETTSKTTSTGTFTFTYYLSSMIIPVDSAGKTYGWSIGITAKLTGSASLADGTSIDATPWSGTMSSVIKWSEVATSMTFVSTTVGVTPTP